MKSLKGQNSCYLYRLIVGRIPQSFYFLGSIMNNPQSFFIYLFWLEMDRLNFKKQIELAECVKGL
jgi:hypothetical protein